MRDDYAIITHDQLARKLETNAPDNEGRRNGFALVNVLGREAFERERIPGSVNIPSDQIDAMEERFDPGKEIIVHCASRDCDASTRVARELTNRGYHRIVDFEAGMSAWKAAEQPVTGNGA